MERKPFILYRSASGGKGGKSTMLHSGILKTRHYTNRRSTSKTAKGAAENQARKWLAEGLPVRDAETFVRYLEEFWAEGSQYLAGTGGAAQASLRSLRGQRALRDYEIRDSLAHRARKGKAPSQRGDRRTPGIPDSLPSRQGLGPSRVNGIIKAVRVPLGQAFKMGRIRENPARQVEKLPGSAPKRQILEMEEAERFFSLKWRDPRYYGFNLIAATTGMRLGRSADCRRRICAKTISTFATTGRTRNRKAGR